MRGFQPGSTASVLPEKPSRRWTVSNPSQTPIEPPADVAFIGLGNMGQPMLPTGKVVRAVVEAMSPHLRPGAVIVDMSSAEPIATRKLGEELIAAGYAFVD